MSLLTVVEPFAVFDSNGFPTVYSPGRLVRDDDPVVKGREPHFESADVVAARSAAVETATAEPGERRTRAAAKPRKRAAKKATAKAPAKPAGKVPDSPLPTGENAPADPPKAEQV